MSDDKKHEKPAAPMCSACRVLVCGVPARVMSIEHLKEKRNRFDSPRDQAKMTLPFCTSSSLEIIDKLSDTGKALDKEICCDYGNGKVFSYLDCHVEKIFVSSSPGCRMEMTIEFSYLIRTENPDMVTLEPYFKPKRVLVWNDFLAFLHGGMKAALKNFGRKS